MLALRGEAFPLFAVVPCQQDRVCLYDASAMSKSFPLAWEAAVYDQHSIITLDNYILVSFDESEQ